MTSEEQLREFGQLICRIAAGKTMTRQESCEAYRQVILNEQPELQQGAFLMAHTTRGPSIEELSGVWDALDKYDTAKFKTKIYGPVCDIAETGSDALKTVSCSTPAALIASACGLPVAKKGARKVTGISGASDIFEVLGINLSSPLENAKQCLEKHGICYLAAEAFLKSGWARLIESMRFTSAFNIIAPLTLPCIDTNSIVIGAYSPNVCDQLIAVLREIGMKSAVAPYGMVYKIDKNLGMDEYSISGPTRVVELRNDKIETYEVTPEDFDLKPRSYGEIALLDSSIKNSKAIFEVLTGRYDSALADLFCMNAAAALYISDFAGSYRQGLTMAKEALSSGKAYEQLKYLKELQS